MSDFLFLEIPSFVSVSFFFLCQLIMIEAKVNRSQILTAYFNTWDGAEWNGIYWLE